MLIDDMTLYFGTKTIAAKPMTRGEFWPMIGRLQNRKNV